MNAPSHDNVSKKRSETAATTEGERVDLQITRSKEGLVRERGGLLLPTRDHGKNN